MTLADQVLQLDEEKDLISVLDKGFVRLDNSMADDLSVVNSARVSFGKRKEDMDDADEGLIRFLMRESHGTPFEHNAFKFHIKAPIFVVREWQRHRIGSFNEMSGRYMELPREWYVPKVQDVRVRVGKPGNYVYSQAHAQPAGEFIRMLEKQCSTSYDAYLYALSMGIAPEQARCFLHVNHYTEQYWTVNARSLMNFINLRNAPTAQWEIRQYARAVEVFFSEMMPHTWKAFENNGRVAP